MAYDENDSLPQDQDTNVHGKATLMGRRESQSGVTNTTVDGSVARTIYLLHGHSSSDRVGQFVAQIP